MRAISEKSTKLLVIDVGGSHVKALATERLAVDLAGWSNPQAGHFRE